MITGLIIYLLAMFGATLSTGLGMLLVLRVLQGMSAGAATIVSRVVIRDLFAGPAAQRLMARVMMMFALAPEIGRAPCREGEGTWGRAMEQSVGKEKVEQ